MSTLPARWCDAGELPEDSEGEPTTLHAGDRDLVLVRAKSGLKVFQGHCPHQGALLGEGEMEGGLLVCRNHRWKFDCESGEKQGGTPACLEQFECRVKDGRLQVNLPALKHSNRDTTSSTRRCPKDLPGPKGSLLLGNARAIDPDRFHNILESWAQEYGSPFSFRLANHRFVGFTDPKAITEVLRQRPDTFRRARKLEPIFDELGVNGVFSSEGDAWRPQRKLAMAALSHRNVKNFYDVLATITERLRLRWIQVADTGRVIDILDDLKRFTVDVTTRLTFGHDANTLEQGDDVIQRHMEMIFPELSRRLQSLVPYWRVIKMPRDRDVDKAMVALRDWLAPIMAETRRRLAENPNLADHPTNFLESMLSSLDENEEPFSEERIIGNALTILLAGEDTTANTLAWSVHHLLDRAESVTRLQDELDQTVGRAHVPSSLQQAQGLAFASAVANETMRISPVAPLMFLDANKPTVVGNVEIDSQHTVALILRPAGLDESIMKDGKTFMPERWLDPSTAERAQQKLVHIPFGSGPRICPGRSLALLELNMVLAVLYKNFHVDRVGKSSEVEERFSFAMVPTNLRVKLRRR